MGAGDDSLDGTMARMIAAGTPQHVPYDVFLVMEKASDDRHEWVDGVVYAMSRGSPEHGRLTNRVVGKILTPLLVCLALATEVLPARAAIIHFFDIEKREWVVACTRGKETHRLLTMRAPEADEILRECARKRRALVVPNAASATSERYRQLGGGRSLIAAPIMQGGRALGALEIINPLDGMPFTEDEGNAMTYIAEQFAEYLGSRGVVLDRERIHSAAAAR